MFSLAPRPTTREATAAQVVVWDAAAYSNVQHMGPVVRSEMRSASFLVSHDIPVISYRRMISDGKIKTTAG